MSAILPTSLWSHLAGPERAAVLGRPDDQRLAHELATLLQRQFISSGCQSGELIGTLPDIRRRYGLGRWACREAVGILEMRGWLKLRRGAGGGLILTLPTIQHLAKLMLVHLCLKGARVEQVIEARRVVHRIVVRKLTTPDGVPPAVSELLPQRSLALDSRIQSQGFSRWLAARTGNPVLSFLMEFVTALYDECADTVAVARVAQQEQLWDAIRGGDESGASAALEDFLEGTERLERGEKVGLPRMFPRDGSGTSATYAVWLAQRLMREIAQRVHFGRMDLGNEAEIGERHHLNRDIVRRAVRMLEDIGVVVSRRGANGGLTTREPDLAAVVELIPQMLWQRSISSSELCEALFFLKFEAARLAAVRVHRGLASDKAVGLAEQLLHTAPTQRHELIMMENSLLDLAENDVLAACDRGMLFYAPVLPAEFTDPAGPQATRAIANNLKIIEAIRAGDVPRTEAAYMQQVLGILSDGAPAFLTDGAPVFHATRLPRVADPIRASISEPRLTSG